MASASKFMSTMFWEPKMSLKRILRWGRHTVQVNLYHHITKYSLKPNVKDLTFYMIHENDQPQRQTSLKWRPLLVLQPVNSAHLFPRLGMIRWKLHNLVHLQPQLEYENFHNTGPSTQLRWISTQTVTVTLFYYATKFPKYKTTPFHNLQFSGNLIHTDKYGNSRICKENQVQSNYKTT